MLVIVTYGDEQGPLAIAHRGGMALAPENTLAAFARATALGLRYLETDVLTTRDGHLVCFHDTTLQRVTGAPGAVADRDLAAVRRLRVHGTDTVPTLSEALHAFPHTRFAIDLKDQSAVGAMADLLRANPTWARRICLAGAWNRWLVRLQAEAPDVTTALGWRSLTTLVAGSRSRPPLRRPRPGTSGAPGAPRGAFAHVPLRIGGMPVYAERVVARAHHLGIRVVVWTVNDQPTMHRLLDAGVDGIITDRPDLLREVLIRRGLWSPLPGPASQAASVGPAEPTGSALRVRTSHASPTNGSSSGR